MMKFFNFLGVDGLAHFAVTALLTWLLVLLAPACAAAFGWNPVYTKIGFAVAPLLAGILKEGLWDWAFSQGTPSWKDIACDVAGAIVGGLPYVFITA